MARRMERTLSVPLAAEFTLADVSRALAEVERHRSEEVPASLNTIIVAATARALNQFPEVAAEVDYETWCRRIPDKIDVGVAVATKGGLVVVVVREPVQFSVVELAYELQRLVDAARAGETDASLFAGGHFTITNVGSLPIYGGTPLPNTPQIAILGVSAHWDAPVVIGGEIKVSKLVRLTIAIDHRALDGMTAARFLVAIKDRVEAPALL
jgi:pyruvate/2-oxoglutarate dehydrogenase complex dihydrolipoamide acyltransferase (E2) component